MNKFDPLTFFIRTIGIDLSLIKDFFIGKKYACVVLKNGNIGLAANIVNAENFDFETVESFDTENVLHRLFLLAYFNARLNLFKNNLLQKDIFELINFTIYKEIVMIGYSEPMYNKLTERNVSPVVFDYSKNEKFIRKQELMPDCLKKANSVILTGTTIINNTFSDILNQTKNNCAVFLIGPSVPLSKALFETGKIKGIFGTVFKDNKQSVIDLIKQGEGTDYLKKYGTKIALLKR